MRVVNQSTYFFICCGLFAKLLIVSLFVITRGFIQYLGFIKEVMFGRIIQSVPTIVARKLWNLGSIVPMTEQLAY